MGYNSKYKGEQVEEILGSVAGKYTKPSGGIPASDLAPEVFLQGEKGDKGDKGDTGATGPQGPQGVGVTSVVQTTTSSADGGNNVVTITLSDGKTSTFTVKNGSKGSQGEKGDKGDTGAEGPQGVQGIQGIQGPKGDTGADGAQGPKGDQGDKGDKGDAGAAGANGTNGATFTPSVDSAGNLSWTNNGGLTNPPIVNIKGPKGDSGEGGGGSGEDNRYFTDFTVEEFIEGCKNYDIISEDSTGLLEAAGNNKIICVPFRNMDKGFLVSYYTLFDEDSSGELNISLEYFGVHYEAFSVSDDPLYGNDTFAFASDYIYEDKNEADVFLTVKANTIYEFSNSLESLTIVVTDVSRPSTIKFQAGNDFSLEIYGTIQWANGIIPQIERDVCYELSLSSTHSGVGLVLTPFKPVE